MEVREQTAVGIPFSFLLVERGSRVVFVSSRIAAPKPLGDTTLSAPHLARGVLHYRCDRLIWLSAGSGFRLLLSGLLRMHFYLLDLLTGPKI